jgi:hypothetical protein
VSKSKEKPSVKFMRRVKKGLYFFGHKEMTFVKEKLKILQYFSQNKLRVEEVA